MSLIENISGTQPRQRVSIAGKVRECFDQINAARERGVSWNDLARAFRASKIRVTAHGLRSTYYQVADALLADAEVPRELRNDSAAVPGQTAVSRSIAGLEAQDCARKVQDERKQDASNTQDAACQPQAAGEAQNAIRRAQQAESKAPDASAEQDQARESPPAIKPSDRVASLATQSRPVNSSSLRNENGFVRNIPDNEI